MSEAGRRTLPHHPPVEIANQSVLIFITCTVAKRRPLLSRPEVHQLLREVWCRSNHWLVGRYVLMPDHLHLHCASRTLPRTPLKRWMEFWRATASREWPWPAEKPVWQKDFFDRQLRSTESYAQNSAYRLENPVRAGLVRNAADWPYQGELNPLTWHEAH
jgi:putative transposase